MIGEEGFVLPLKLRPRAVSDNVGFKKGSYGQQ